MYISNETTEQTEQRLRSVIAQAHFQAYTGSYAFLEFPVETFPQEMVNQALALVRDQQVWSALVPYQQPDAELFALFSFHFPANVDNSGFVGWLATHLKTTLGTGVMVICGQNSKQGGIFDYWGVPFSMQEDALSELEKLRKSAVLTAQTS
ncbi:DUF6196 family protein [uncultured Thiothrix sp.]|uniref:DUF6196 family protein n=1 Tax=uncultured Thiothrix sp. TaxID=223185 RepID=UPI0026308D65|nr:DUF6196 family protein [uncultured Thiothrix sp.]